MNINDLPLEMFLYIIKNLSFYDILKAMEVCEVWKVQILESSIWHEVQVIYKNESPNYDNIMRKFSSNSNIIRHLVVQGFNSEYHVKSMIRTFTNLTSFRIVMYQMDSEMMRLLNGISTLTDLYILNCYRIGRTNDKECDLDFTKLPKLQKLALSDFGLSNDNIDTLFSCPDLQQLDIRKIKDITEKNLINLLVHFRDKFTVFDIYGDATNDGVLRYISQCTKLTSLSILRCENITDIGMSHLKKLNLEYLMFWNNTICTEQGLMNLFRDNSLVNLKKLNFSKVSCVTRKVLQLLAIKCLKLNYIGMYLCPNIYVELWRDGEIHALFPNCKIFCVTCGSELDHL